MRFSIRWCRRGNNSIGWQNGHSEIIVALAVAFPIAGDGIVGVGIKVDKPIRERLGWCADIAVADSAVATDIQSSGIALGIRVGRVAHHPAVAETHVEANPSVARRILAIEVVRQVSDSGDRILIDEGALGSDFFNFVMQR